MSPDDLQRTLDVARGLADECSVLALDSYRRGGAIHKKGAVDLVTETDLAVERLVRTRLREAFPEHDLVGEEGDDSLRGDRPIWFVDPIDGTTNFAHGHPQFSISLGLLVDGVPTLGVVAAPALGVTWSGALGLGAVRRWRHASGERVEACRVSTVETLADALCATGFPYDRWTNDDDNTPEHRAFLKRGQGVRRCGSAALDCCFVADGTYDVYWEQRLSPWDVCAGMALVLAAGGTLTDYDGAPADPRRGRLVASNGRVHEEALAVLRDARA
jgi:myo-inositol-1(or 4)-monophosphatase